VVALLHPRIRRKRGTNTLHFLIFTSARRSSLISLPCRSSSTHLEEASPNLSGCTRQVCTFIPASATISRTPTRAHTRCWSPSRLTGVVLALPSLPYLCSLPIRDDLMLLLAAQPSGHMVPFPFPRSGGDSFRGAVPWTLGASSIQYVITPFPSCLPPLPPLDPNISKLTRFAFSLAISPVQRTSRSRSTSARKPTLVHRAGMTRIWALSRSGLNLPISPGWSVSQVLHIFTEN